VNGAPAVAQGAVQKCPIGVAFRNPLNDRLTLAVWLLITKDAISGRPAPIAVQKIFPTGPEATRPAAFSPPHDLCQNIGSSKP
jgi:hypothetical protein